MNRECFELLRVMLARRNSIGPSFWELTALLSSEPQIAVAKLAARVGKTPSGVVKNLRRLEEQGIITRQAIPGRANRYSVRLMAEGNKG